MQRTLKRNDDERKKQLQQDSAQDVQLNIPSKVKDFARIKSAIDMQAGDSSIDNTNKIQELKKKIQQNEYNVDFEQLADKMLEREW